VTYDGLFTAAWIILPALCVLSLACMAVRGFAGWWQQHPQRKAEAVARREAMTARMIARARERRGGTP
jgi:hypothetical protein